MIDVVALVNILQLPVGRRLFALRKVAAAASALKVQVLAAGGDKAARDAETLQDVVDRANDAHAADTEALRRRNQWAELRSGRRHAEGAVALDQRLDALVGGLDAVLEGFVRSFGGAGRGAEAAALRRHLLPRGLGAVINAAYEEELAELTALVARAKDEDDRPDARLAGFGLDAVVAEIERLLPEFAVLVAPGRNGPGFDVVRADHLAGHDRVVRLLLRVGGAFCDRTPQQEAALQALLSPILAQQEAVRDRLRARRAVTDVDPETGHEVVEPTEPADEVAK